MWDEYTWSEWTESCAQIRPRGAPGAVQLRAMHAVILSAGANLPVSYAWL